MKGRRIVRVLVACALALACVSAPPVLRAQGAAGAAGVGALRDQIRARYDIVALQNGVGLVPRDRAAKIRMIEVRDGHVAVDGAALTGGEIRDRLGADADLVLRVTYLDAAGQRELAGVAAVPAPPGDPSAVPAPPAPPAPPATADPDDDRGPGIRINSDDMVRIGGSVKVDRGEVVEGDVVAVGGSATVDGHVEGDVQVVGGSLTVGPEGVIDGEVTIVGGALNRAPGARIEGKVNNVSIGEYGGWNIPGMMIGSFMQRLGSLAATLLRITLLILFGCVVVAVAQPTVERIADRIGGDPVRSGLAGLLAELLFVPLLILTCVVLAVSIIGIPLLVLVPFGIVAFLLMFAVGFTGVAYQLGRSILQRFGWTERGPYAAVALGTIALTSVTIVASLVALGGGFFFGAPLAGFGYLVEYVAWTVGLGAAVMVWYGSRSVRKPSAPATLPPPLPAE